MTDRIGSRLGPYQLVSLLGRGGMGEVYEARDTRLPRTVALKVLPLETSDDAAARSRFEREARAIASLHHPRICVVHDVGVDTGVYFIVMEHLDGETLAARLRRGPLPFDELLLRAIEIAEGLDHAHRAGVVHRDVKPANIMLTSEGIKLLDFGLAALRPVVSDNAKAATTASLTQTGHVLGTLQYMAPEQLEGQEVDARTDLFAFGAVLYEMATAKKVFDASSTSGIIAAILTAAPPSICDIEPSCSPALDWAIRRCLARAPQARWQTAADLAAVLRWIQSTAGSTPQRPESAAPPLHAHARRRRWAVVSALAAIGLLVGAWIVAPRWRTVLPGVSRLPVRAAIPVDAGIVLGEDGLPGLALSPDGSRVVYVGTGKKSTGPSCTSRVVLSLPRVSIPRPCE
jgi:serine/threonine protein kinase